MSRPKYISKPDLVKIICYKANYEQIHINEIIDNFMSGSYSLRNDDINFKDLFDIRLDTDKYINEGFNLFCYNYSPRMN